MNTKYYRCILRTMTIGTCLFLSNGCKKLVETELPIDKLTATAVFNDVGGASAALSNIYYILPRIVVGGGGCSVLNGLASDELVLRNISNQQLQLYFTNSLTSKNFNNWNLYYDLIFRINSVIEGVGNSSGLLSHSKNEIIGQAKFLRAFVYFYLVNLYGGVPIVTSTDYKVNMLLRRSSEAASYDQIIQDLIEAQSLVSHDYLKSNLITVTKDRVAANKAVVTAFLARVYLYLGDWQKAESETTKVLNDSRFAIVQSLNDVFLTNSAEAIWQIEGDVSKGANSLDGSFYIPEAPTAAPVVYVNDNILNEVSDGDKRRKDWLKGVVVGTTMLYYPFKYKQRDAAFGSDHLTTEYNMILRLAEQYLIRAEARAHLNKFDEAIMDLNVIRKRAGLFLYTSLNQKTLLQAIEKERAVELFAELGHRWFDLKRTGRLNEVLGPIKGGNWQQTDQLFPIPSNEFNLNPNLRGHQNPGYTE